MALETIALIGLGVSAVGTGVSALGQYRQGQAAKAAGEYNARVSEANAAAIEQKTVYEEQQSRDRLKRLMGTQRALYAKAGVDISSKSPLLVLADTAAEGEKEARMIKYGGDVEATQQKNQARLQRLYGSSAYSSGLIGAGSTFFSGMGQAGLGYANLKARL